MENAFLLKVLEGSPMHDFHADMLHNAQYTILCAQEADPEKRVGVLLDRLQTSSELNSSQIASFLMNTCVEAAANLDPDAVESMVERLIGEANQHSMWPDFIKWVCAIIHFFCTDDGTICVFYEYGATKVAMNALKQFGHQHQVALACTVLLSHFTLFKVDDAVHQIVHLLQLFSEDEVLCLHATQALAEFLKYDEETPESYLPACEEFAEANGLAVLEKVLENQKRRDPTTIGNQLFHVARIVASVTNSGVLERRKVTSSSPDDESREDADSEESEAAAAAGASSSSAPSGGGLGESRTIQLLCQFLQPQYSPSDAYCSQVFQVLSNVPHSALIDWECIASIFLSPQTSEVVLLWCIHFFSAVAMHAKDVKSLIYSSGCVQRVLDVMRQYENQYSIQEVGCSLISYLSFDSEVITQCITDNGGISVILNAMKRFSANEQLLMAACAALSGLTFNNQDGQQDVVKYGGVALILDAMRHGKKPRLQENGCLAIGTMCWNSDLKAEVVNYGGVEIIMNVLEEHYTSSGVVKNAFRALAQIAFNCEQYRNEMSRNGVIPLIIRGMEHHQKYDRAQMHGCVALSYLSWTNQGNAAQIIAHRGYQVVVEAMRNYPNSHEVQEHAARALANISEVSLSDAAAALEQIVASMKRHERCAEVQEESCRAIVTLSLASPVNKDRLYQLGGAGAVVAAMTHFPRHQLVQQEACNALAHLAYEHANLNREVTELHGVQLLLTAMETHVDSPKVQLNACGGLSALAFDNPVAQKQIFELNGVQCVIRAMENFERLRMLELGCSALGTLAWNTDIKEEVAVQAVPEILKAMRAHEDNPLLQKSTCRAISQFAFNSESNRQLLADAGAIPLIVNAMRIHLSSEKLVAHALKALTYLCWENVNVAEKIIHENVEEVLQSIVDHYSQHSRIYGEAVHLSKILFRKTAGSLTPSRLISPPLTSPPLRMVPPTPQQGYHRRGGGARGDVQQLTPGNRGGRGWRPDGGGRGAPRGRGGTSPGGRYGGGIETAGESSTGSSGGLGGSSSGGARTSQDHHHQSHRDPNNHYHQNQTRTSPGGGSDRFARRSPGGGGGGGGASASASASRYQPSKYHQSHVTDPDALWDDPDPSTFHGRRSSSGK